MTAEELRRLAGGRPVSEIFSWKSPAARQRGLKPAGQPDDELIQLMLEEPRLIRRPMIQAGDRLIVGLDREAIAALGR